MAGGPQLRQRGVAHHVEVVQFDRVDRKIGQDLGRPAALAASLPGEPQNDMNPQAQVSLGGPLHRVEERREVVSPVQERQSLVAGTLQSQFQRQPCFARQSGQKVENLVADTVRPCPDRQPADLRMADRLAIDRLQTIDRCVGVGRGLKVGDERRLGESARHSSDSLIDLLGDRTDSQPPGGGKSAIIAEDTPPRCDGSVAVWAGKPRVHAHLSDRPAESLAKVTGKGVVIFFHRSVFIRTDPLRSKRRFSP